MTTKSTFIKSAKIAIAGVTLAASLAACGAIKDKHACKSAAESEKSGCSSKNSCSSNGAKAGCSAKHSCSS